MLYTPTTKENDMSYENLDGRVRKMEREIVYAIQNGTYDRAMTRELNRLRAKRDRVAERSF